MSDKPRSQLDGVSLHISYWFRKIGIPLLQHEGMEKTLKWRFFFSVFFFCCVGKLDINNTKDLYRDLVSVFDKLILPTHASCHVQYFMFYICSFKLVSTTSLKRSVFCHFCLVLAFFTKNSCFLL